MTATHRELCRAAAAWMQGLGWCDVACWELREVTPDATAEEQTRRGREAHAAMVAARDDAEYRRLRDQWERDRPRAGIYDAVGVTCPQRHARGLEWATARGKRKPPRPRLQIVEVKRTRSDLLSDLRAGKMLKYEQLATHCLLAVVPDAVVIRQQQLASDRPRHTQILDALADLGLPTRWGVAVFYTGGPSILRQPRRLPTVVTDADRARVITAVARSLMYRGLAAHSPVELADPDDLTGRTT